MFKSHLSHDWVTYQELIDLIFVWFFKKKIKALQELTQQVEELDRLKTEYYRQTLETEKNNLKFILSKVSTVIRAEVDIYERIYSKGTSDPILEGVGVVFLISLNFLLTLKNFLFYSLVFDYLCYFSFFFFFAKIFSKGFCNFFASFSWIYFTKGVFMQFPICQGNSVLLLLLLLF